MSKIEPIDALYNFLDDEEAEACGVYYLDIRYSNFIRAFKKLPVYKQEQIVEILKSSESEVGANE